MAGWVGAEPGQESGRGGGADLICSLTDGSPITHGHPPASHVGAERAAHGGVGEAAREEEKMIVIEYEMSITWNEHTVQARRGTED